MTSTGQLAAALDNRYRIERELGAGGMATVYLAHDVKHDRKVAIKVLKPELAAVLGGERFVVEIKTTAALQHPHILPLFDSGEADGFLYYVMPYIQGETIREKLNRETQFGVDDAVRIAREVADALDYAHRHGVIHRDIKPENILLHDGRAMVMDFGIALAVSAAAGGRMTETGLSLGTPHYMSPEQATAEKDISARSDVYSLAAVLYEMLSGEPPHMGNSAQQIIMKIITEPAAPVTRLRKSVPPNVAAAVAKALEKLPADRFENAKSFSDALANPSFALTAGSSRPLPGMRRTRNRALIGMTILATALAVLLVIPALRTRAMPDSAGPVVRFVLADDPGLRITASTTRPFALSPDGHTIVFRATADSTGPRLWVRDIDDPHARPLAGTDGGMNAAISPDGKWIAFFASRGLQKVRVSGGEVTRIATLEAVTAALSWASNDEIVFEQLTANADRPIHRVSANGGRVEVAVPLDTAAKESGQRRPLVLRDAGIIVYSSTIPGEDEASLVLYRRSDRRRVRLAIAGNSALGLMDDYLVYSRLDGAVMAVKIDLRAMRVIGDPVALNTRAASGSTGTAVALSENGTLVYRTAGSMNAARLNLVDTMRAIRSIPGTFAVQGAPRFSPDGRRLVVNLGPNAEVGRKLGVPTSDLWMVDVATGEPTRLTSGNNAASPSWMSDGRRMAYLSAVNDRFELWSLTVGGGAPPSRLLAIDANIARFAMLPDDRSVILQTQLGQAHGLPPGLYRAWVDGSARVDTLLISVGSGVRPMYPRVSPDGRWVAYVDRGGLDVWVQSLSDHAALQVSANPSDGNSLVWGADSRHVYYGQSDGLVAVELRTDPTLSVVQRQTIRGFPANEGYDLAPDGKTFVIVAPLRNSSDIFVAVNWGDDARRELRAAQKK